MAKEDPFLADMIASSTRAKPAKTANPKKGSKPEDEDREAKPADSLSSNKLLREIAVATQKKKKSSESRSISLRMPVNTYNTVQQAMESVGERSMSAFILAVLQRTLG